jgi:hypothetical protein
MPLRPSKRVRRELGRAATGAVVGGMDRYGPHAVGLTLVALPACAVAAFSHFVLDAPPYVASGAAAGAIALYHAAWRWSRGKR